MSGMLIGTAQRQDLMSKITESRGEKLESWERIQYTCITRETFAKMQSLPFALQPILRHHGTKTARHEIPMKNSTKRRLLTWFNQEIKCMKSMASKLELHVNLFAVSESKLLGVSLTLALMPITHESSQPNFLWWPKDVCSLLKLSLFFMCASTCTILDPNACRVKRVSSFLVLHPFKLYWNV